MKIWANTIVKNEERYVWFAITSVIDYVDKILIWDTGSTDNTIKIIEELIKKYPSKVIFEKKNNINAESYTEARQEMLEITRKNADWLIILDGDEVWWDESISRIVELINKEGQNLDSIVSEFKNLIRDIYHYQSESAGLYKIDGKIGHLTIRAFNMSIPGLHHAKPHGQQGQFDDKGVLVQERDNKKRKNIGLSFLHFTNLIRSSSLQEDHKVMKRSFKYKYELGNEFPFDYYYPEVFFKPRPNIVPSPWILATEEYMLKAHIQTPLKKIKRKLLPKKKGY